MPGTLTLDDDELRPWQETPPDQAGAWELACMECGEDIDAIPVYLKRGALWCDSDIGSMPVQMLHDGLTAVRWRRAA